ncbi:MAG: MOSC domain-containing protein [Actinobacteria bacterium]|nr:MOSC domain-containing protein [Actinomycetota bacterium]
MAGKRVVVSVNVARPRPLKIGGRVRETGIFKEPQTGRIPIRGETVGDDVQVDRRHHGGRFKAVYAYAEEDYLWWSSQLGVELGPGSFGENITTRGLDVTSVLIGERWRVGRAEIEVSDPRVPCSTLASKMRLEHGVKGFVKKFVAARRFGAYFLITEPGDVAAGDDIEVIHRPEHGVTITDIADLVYAPDRAKAEEYLIAYSRQEQRDDWMGLIQEVEEKASRSGDGQRGGDDPSTE